MSILYGDHTFVVMSDK